MVIASAGFSQYTGVVYFYRIYVFPAEDAVFQNHIAVGLFSFGMFREPGLRQTFPEVGNAFHLFLFYPIPLSVQM